MLALTVFTACSVVTPLPWFFWLAWSLMTTCAVVDAVRGMNTARGLAAQMSS